MAKASAASAPRSSRSRSRAAALARSAEQQQQQQSDDNGDDNNEDRPTAGGRAEQPRRPTEAARRRAAVSRSVAEREASRLARPERRGGGAILPHASRSRSAVTSTPTGVVVAAASGNPEGEEEQWCGPFSVARRMIAARDEARAKREAELRSRQSKEHHPLDEVVEHLEAEENKRVHPSLRWKGKIVQSDDSDDSDDSDEGDDDGGGRSNGKKRKKRKSDNLYVKRKKRLDRTKRQAAAQSPTSVVPSLFQTCVNYLVKHFEHVEGLGDRVDGTVRRKICEELVSEGKLDGDAFSAIAEVGIEALEIIDCAQITQDQLAPALKALLPAGLTVLILNHAGRCFGPKAVQAIVECCSSPSLSTTSSRSPSSLCALSIGGGYLLKDSDAATLIGAVSRTLSSIEFVACPLLGNEFCHSVQKCYSSSPPPSIKGAGGGITSCAPLLELALEDLQALTKEDLLSVATGGALRNLKSLRLRQIDILDDDVVEALLNAASSATGDGEAALEGINLGRNANLTDRTLQCVRRCNRLGNLRSLHLEGLKNLTAAGLGAFFARGITGLPPPPCLRTLDLSQCADGAVTDDVVASAAFVASMKFGDGGVAREDDDDDDGEDDKSDEDQAEDEGDDEEKDSLADQHGLSEKESGANSAEKSPRGLSSSRSGRGIVYLNVGGATAVSDSSMEKLAETCSYTLREIDVSFCPGVTDKGLGYLVSVAGNQLSKIHVWGCAQITDEFLDGHGRVDDGRLEIVGAWMKKSGARSLR